MAQIEKDEHQKKARDKKHGNVPKTWMEVIIQAKNIYAVSLKSVINKIKLELKKIR